MQACPHCAQDTIRDIAKALSAPALPVKCSACGGLSCVMGWKMYTLSFLASVLVTALATSALFLWTWIPLVAAFAVMAALPFIFVKFLPLIPIAAIRVFRERLFLAGLLGILVVRTLIGAFTS